VLVATAGEGLVGASRPSRPISRPWGPPSGVARSGAPVIGGRGPPKATGSGTCPDPWLVRGRRPVPQMSILGPAPYVSPPGELGAPVLVMFQAG